MVCILEKGSDVIYSIGGANTDGYSYRLTVSENPEWIPLERQYSSLFSSVDALPDKKFMFKSAVNLR
jgi:hypothetical protein